MFFLITIPFLNMIFLTQHKANESFDLNGMKSSTSKLDSLFAMYQVMLRPKFTNDTRSTLIFAYF